MSTAHSTCSHCGKPLKHLTCYACEGKGYARELAFMKRACTVCQGSGWVWQCEDEFKHVVEAFKAAHDDNEHAPARPLKRRPATNAETIPDWEPTHFHPINPENPWNLNDLGNLSPKATPPSSSHKHRPNRNAVKK